MSNGGKISSTISTQVIAASLTMITVMGAFAVFIFEKREIGFWYFLIVGIAFLSFVISIFLGGLGMSGKGANKKTNPYFDWQAKTALIGIILFCISLFLGKTKPEELEKRISDQDKVIIELKMKDEFKEKEIQRLNDNMNTLTKQLNEIQNKSLQHDNLRNSGKSK